MYQYFLIILYIENYVRTCDFNPNSHTNSVGKAYVGSISLGILLSVKVPSAAILLSL